MAIGDMSGKLLHMHIDLTGPQAIVSARVQRLVEEAGAELEGIEEFHVSLAPMSKASLTGTLVGDLRTSLIAAAKAQNAKLTNSTVT